jgi:hypothetical protein
VKFVVVNTPIPAAPHPLLKKKKKKKKKGPMDDSLGKILRSLQATGIITVDRKLESFQCAN